MRIKMSEIEAIPRDYCDKCGKELGDPTEWHRDALGNRFCSYTCKEKYKKEQDRRQNGLR